METAGPKTVSSDDKPASPAMCAHRGCRAVVLVLVAWGCLQGAIQLVLNCPGIPYNVSQLFCPAYMPLRVACLSLMLLVLSLGAAGASIFTAGGRAWRVLLMPLWAAAISLVGWPLLQFAVTRESLWDILGWPVLQWPGDWELIGRFTALAGGSVLAVMVGGVCVLVLVRRGCGAGAMRSALAFAWSMPWLVLAWLVVIRWACTDNLTELIRSDWSYVPGTVSLSMLCMLIGGAASASGIAVLRGTVRGIARASIVLLVLLPVGWALLQMGLEPEVSKYGKVFPAVRFLLGASRDSQISTLALAGRWCAVQLGLTIALAWGYVAALSSLRTKTFTNPSAM